MVMLMSCPNEDDSHAISGRKVATKTNGPPVRRALLQRLHGWVTYENPEVYVGRNSRRAGAIRRKSPAGCTRGWPEQSGSGPTKTWHHARICQRLRRLDRWSGKREYRPTATCRNGFSSRRNECPQPHCRDRVGLPRAPVRCVIRSQLAYGRQDQRARAFELFGSSG